MQHFTVEYILRITIHSHCVCSSSPGIAKISFTGSTATGRRIMAEAAKRGVPTCMELGGKSCLIVFDDVNIENAVEWAMVNTLALVMLQSDLRP